MPAKKKQMPLHLVVHFHARLCSYMSRISLLLVHILIGMNASMHKKQQRALTQNEHTQDERVL